MKQKITYYLIVLLTLGFVISCGKNGKNPVDNKGKDTYDRLIISEVHLLSVDSNKNWIEVYNPADTSFILTSMGMSNVWAWNILPPYIRRNGGYKLEPDNFLIICADSTKKPNAEFEYPAIQVASLSQLDKDGGYFRISTQVGDDEIAEGFRYGNRDYTEKYKELCGDFVIDYCDSNMSYHRIYPYESMKYIYKYSAPGY